MSSFTEPLVIVEQGDEWLTTRPLVYEVGKLGSGLAITVPVSFPTDLATIPRWAWFLFSPTSAQYSAAAVLHDYLCTEPGFNRRIADSIFLEALEVLGVGLWRRKTMFYAVRLYAAWLRKLI